MQEGHRAPEGMGCREAPPRPPDAALGNGARRDEEARGQGARGPSSVLQRKHSESQHFGRPIDWFVVAFFL